MLNARRYGVHTRWRDIKRCWQLGILLLPGLIWLVLFCYAPMGGLVIAFKNFRPKLGIWDSPWVGLKYFQQFFSTNIAVNTILNTLRLSINTLIWSFPIPILLALMINQIHKSGMRRFIQTAIYAPYFVSNVVVVSILSVILNPTTGFVNHLLEAAGIGSRMFMARPEYFTPVYVVSGIWQTAGFNTIIYLATLTNVDPALHEAAAIDGAGRLGRMLHVSLPALAPVITIQFIMRVGNILSQGYEKVILLYRPLTFETADIISSYVYRSGLLNSNYSFGAAVSVFNSIVNLAILVLANSLSRRLSETSLW